MLSLSSPSSQCHRLSLTFLCFGIAFMLTSCGDSRISQCNQLVAIVNKAAEEARDIDKMSQASQGDKTNELKKMTDRFQQFAKEIDDITLENPDIKNFQKQFVSLYNQTSQSSQNLRDAIAKKNKSQVDNNLKAFGEVSTLEAKLVEEVNRYCEGVN